MISWHGFQTFLETFCYYAGGSNYYQYNHTFHVPRPFIIIIIIIIIINHHPLDHYNASVVS